MTLRMLRPGNGEPNKCVSVYNHSMNMSYTRIHTHVVSCVSCAFVCTRPLASAVRFDATKHTITTQRLNDGSEATNIGRPSSETPQDGSDTTNWGRPSSEQSCPFHRLGSLVFKTPTTPRMATGRRHNLTRYAYTYFTLIMCVELKGIHKQARVWNRRF